MTRPPTISDIAADCNVSLSTVSLVLNNNPRISEKTRAKVLAAVEKFGYQPNVQARGLASRSSRTLSVVVPQLKHVFSDIYFGEIVSGIYERASESEYKVMLDIANAKFIETNEYLNLLKSRRADGMLFVGSSITDDYVKALEGAPYPFLLVNHYYPESLLSYVMVDYKQSARLAAEHLLGLGHRKIGVIAGTNTYTGLDLRDTFIATCKDAGLRDEDLPWVDGGADWSREGGYTAAENLFEMNGGLTAILAANDPMAIGAMHFIQSKGRIVPDDISVMGMDDTPHARFTSPELTTVHHSLYEVGRMTCDRVLAMFRREIVSCRDIIPSELVVRKSTGLAKEK